MFFKWDETKNVLLQFERGLSFEQVVSAIAEGKVLDILEHTDKGKYPNQILIVVDINGYACVIPAAKNGEVYFLKTIFRSRKYTKKYLM
jgi:uncharacterized DUF497 family protein